MTKFDKMKESLTVEQFAQMMVKVAIMNGSDAYYVTSTGQLYSLNNDGFSAAVKHELSFWSQEEVTNTEISKED